MTASRVDNVTILCSGFGLGFYIPGLLIADKLRQAGVEVDVEVFESVMMGDKLKMVERNRKAYHQNFRVALTSQKIPGDTRESLDKETIQALLRKWENEDRRRFISLSGHWVHVLDAYRKSRRDCAVAVDLLYVDADLAPSWRWLSKLNVNYAAPYREVRLYDRTRADVILTIDANCGPPAPFSTRQQRLVVHGGGWGIGTFQERITTLEAAGLALDVACYQESELASHNIPESDVGIQRDKPCLFCVCLSIPRLTRRTGPACTVQEFRYFASVQARGPPVLLDVQVKDWVIYNIKL